MLAVVNYLIPRFNNSFKPEARSFQQLKPPIEHRDFSPWGACMQCGHYRASTMYGDRTYRWDLSDRYCYFDLIDLAGRTAVHSSRLDSISHVPRPISRTDLT